MKDIWAKREACIRYEGNQIVLFAPFNGDFVLALKSGTTSRRWNPEKGAWMIHISERDKALEILERYFDVIKDDQSSEIDQSVQAEPINPVCPERPLEVREGDHVEIWTDGAC